MVADAALPADDMDTARLAELSMGLAQAGCPAVPLRLAAATEADVRARVRAGTSPLAKDELAKDLANVATAFSHAADPESAARLAAEARDMPPRGSYEDEVWTLAAVTMALAMTGDVPGALKAAREIPTWHYTQAQVFSDVAMAMAATGDPDGAEEFATANPIAVGRAGVLIELGKAAIKGGDTGRAGRLYRKVTLIRSSDPRYRAYVFPTLAIALAEAGYAKVASRLLAISLTGEDVRLDRRLEAVARTAPPVIRESAQVLQDIFSGTPRLAAPRDFRAASPGEAFLDCSAFHKVNSEFRRILRNALRRRLRRLLRPPHRPRPRSPAPHRPPRGPRPPRHRERHRLTPHPPGQPTAHTATGQHPARQWTIHVSVPTPPGFRRTQPGVPGH
jgi:hypothetical protein